MDNSQFTEEQRAEAYRVESMQQMVQQTKALESMRSSMTFFVFLTLINLVLGLFAVVAANS